jgi:tryptophanyl-tRNA synthetase
LYDTTIVPVGEDQMQHLELTRVLARRFNETFGPTFTIPQALIQKVGARIMGLDDASTKMSKSAKSAYNYISLMDDAETIRKKIMRAVTDTNPGVEFDLARKPAIANLMTIYHQFTGETMPAIEAKYAGKGYGDFKKDLAEICVAHLEPISKRIHEYVSDKAELTRILNTGRDKAHETASKKMALIRERLGVGRAE